MLISLLVLHLDREWNEKLFIFMETTNSRYAAEPEGDINARHLLSQLQNR
jgi:hypothetical protein